MKHHTTWAVFTAAILIASAVADDKDITPIGNCKLPNAAQQPTQPSIVSRFKPEDTKLPECYKMHTSCYATCNVDKSCCDELMLRCNREVCIENGHSASECLSNFTWNKFGGAPAPVGQMVDFSCNRFNELQKRCKKLTIGSISLVCMATLTNGAKKPASSAISNAPNVKPTAIAPAATSSSKVEPPPKASVKPLPTTMPSNSATSLAIIGNKEAPIQTAAIVNPNTNSENNNFIDTIPIPSKVTDANSKDTADNSSSPSSQQGQPLIPVTGSTDIKLGSLNELKPNSTAKTQPELKAPAQKSPLSINNLQDHSEAGNKPAPHPPTQQAPRPANLLPRNFVVLSQPGFKHPAQTPPDSNKPASSPLPASTPAQNAAPSESTTPANLDSDPNSLIATVQIGVAPVLNLLPPLAQSNSDSNIPVQVNPASGPAQVVPPPSVQANTNTKVPAQANPASGPAQVVLPPSVQANTNTKVPAQANPASGPAQVVPPPSVQANTNTKVPAQANPASGPAQVVPPPSVQANTNTKVPAQANPASGPAQVVPPPSVQANTNTKVPAQANPASGPAQVVPPPSVQANTNTKEKYQLNLL
ncbi:hypothetical protein BDF19DRAFT_273043 [Syncephalis fuscata]|nr:hypothetical protein BDF19DRAFT_273043 [Syncephalis fuscata]